jgi:hypothetical protein
VTWKSGLQRKKKKAGRNLQAEKKGDLQHLVLPDDCGPRVAAVRTVHYNFSSIAALRLAEILPFHSLVLRKNFHVAAEEVFSGTLQRKADGCSSAYFVL